MHLTGKCNYACEYCFGKFNGDFITLNNAKTLVDKISDYFKSEEIENGTINLAGGEPFLYPSLNELIDYIVSSGIQVSIVTNGSLLNKESIENLKGKVSCIGISIDSICQNTNIEIGRCSRESALSLSECEALSKTIHDCGIKLKINTVISRYNLDEDLMPLYKVLRPERIKFLQMHIVKGVNDKALDKQITKDEFYSFCERYDCLNSQSEIVKEESGKMENSYLMIDPCGNFILNNGGKYDITYGNCFEKTISEIVRSLPLSQEKYDYRYN